MVCQPIVLVLLIPRGVLSLMMILNVQLLTGFALNLNSALMVNHVSLVLLIVQKT